jgi:hypothetical protein
LEGFRTQTTDVDMSPHESGTASNEIVRFLGLQS